MSKRRDRTDQRTAELEHSAFGEAHIQVLRENGALNHPDSCSGCRPHATSLRAEDAKAANAADWSALEEFTGE